MEYYSSLDASQLDKETPTLFELISANQLETLLSPSLRYVLVHFTARHPRYLLAVANRFDELNLVLRALVEWYFLHFWQGSFTENFYGLKRVNQTRLATSPKWRDSRLTQLTPAKMEERRQLTPRQVAASLFEVVGTTYVGEKLSHCYEVWYPKYVTRQLKAAEDATAREQWAVRLKIRFVQLYPYAQSAVRAANFITTLMYLSGAHKSPSLITYLCGINFSRLNQYDYDKNDPERAATLKRRARAPRVSPPTALERLVRVVTAYLTRPSWRAARYVLGTFFPVAIFTLKFLEWWNNLNFTQKIAKSLGNLLESVLPAPSTLAERQTRHPPETAAEKQAPPMAYKSGSLCPLCHQQITNPAIIETGYVFCYTCIYAHLQRSHKLDDDDDDDKSEKSDPSASPRGGRCPITGRKLLGCKWNAVKQEWDIDGIRRLIF